MQGHRALAFVLGGILLLGAAVLFLMQSGPSGAGEQASVLQAEAPPAAGVEAQRSELPVGAARAQPEELPAAPALAVAAVAVEPPAVPESFRRALGGLTGRVLEPTGAPVSGMTVELVGGRKSSFMKPADSFLQPGGLDVNLIAGSAVTNAEGRFRLAEIEPRTMGGLILDPAGPRAVLHPLTISPVSGTDQDLGDIVMPATATLTGRIVDERGGPLPGVRVRATELPMAGMPGIEPIVGAIADFRSGDAMYVSDDDKEFVFVLPDSLARLEKHLPIPTAITDADGRFTLGGVMPGIITLAADDGRHIPAVKTGLPSGAAGQTRDVGTLSMGDGNTLRGRVLTEKREPVVGAELLAGTSLGIAPAALLKGPVLTDAEGRFEVHGLRAGEIFAAARTDRRQGYTTASVADATQELIITLPSPRTFTLRLRDDTGAPVTGARLFGRVIPDDDTPDFLVPPKPLDGQVATTEPGLYDIGELQPGEWQFTVHAPGFGAERIEADLRASDSGDELRLQRAGTLAVRVLRATDKSPVEWACVEAFQEDNDMPAAAGRTDASGRVVLGGLLVRDANIVVTHPGYAITSEDATVQPAGTLTTSATGPGPTASGSEPGGSIASSAVADGASAASPVGASGAAGSGSVAEVVVELTSGGTIVGTVIEHNGPPARPLMILLMQEQAAGDAELPRTTVADAEGRFRFERVEPGSTHIEARSKDELGSGLSLFEAFFNSPLAEVELDVPADGEVPVLLVVGANLQGKETGFVSGQLRVNGRAAPGWKVSTWGEIRRSVVTDDAGRFDLGQIAAGDVTVAFSAAGTSLMEGSTYSEDFKLANGERKLLQVSFGTGGLSGRVTSSADGRPLADVVVRAVPADEGDGWRRSGSAVSGQDGGFTFDTLSAGSYRISGRADGYANASSEPVKVSELSQVTGIELRLTRAIKVSGTLTVTDIDAQPQWMWIIATAAGSNARDTSGVDREEHTFSFDGMSPGEWTFTLATDKDTEFAPITMQIDRDTTGLQLAFVPAPETAEPEAAHADGVTIEIK